MTTISRTSRAVGAAALLAALAACGGVTAAADPADVPTEPTSTAAAPSAPVVEKDEHGDPKGLHNHRRWSERIGSGAQPEGEIAFRNLAALGYRVVVSVDGARPDLELAAKHGLRYVHIPIGYDGLDPGQRLAVAKAVETAEGPVFFH
jgi:hypothetical protein